MGTKGKPSLAKVVPCNNEASVFEQTTQHLKNSYYEKKYSNQVHEEGIEILSLCYSDVPCHE